MIEPRLGEGGRFVHNKTKIDANTIAAAGYKVQKTLPITYYT